jgi:uncharacterized protein YcbX
MQVSSLAYHPVKSMRGTPAEALEFDVDGVRHDRRLMLVDPDGERVSMRGYPALTKVRPRVESDGLEIALPNWTTLRVPFHRSGARCVARMWGGTVEVTEPELEASLAISEWLDAPVRLVTRAEGVVRPPVGGIPQEFELNLSDFGQVLIASTASLADLNDRLDHEIPMERFRPNIVVDGSQEPWAEDGWKRIRVGTQEFEMLSPCQRCAMIGIDPDTGERDPEPLRTMAAFRFREQPLRGVYFGIQVARATSGPGSVAIGDSVEVIR